jgi:NAD-specific glutamate dehydrogenase
VLAIFRPGIEALQDHIPAILSPTDRAAWEGILQLLSVKGVPRALAERMASLEHL